MKKEYNFEKAKRVLPDRVDSNPKIMISLRLDPMIIAAIKDEADAIGIGYQTLISSILEKHVHPLTESFEDKVTKRILSRLETSGTIKKKTKKKKTA